LKGKEHKEINILTFCFAFFAMPLRPLRLGFAIPFYLPNTLRPSNKNTTNTTTKRKKKNLAIDAAPSAILPKPKTAATIAITKKMAAQRNMFVFF